MLDLDDVCDGQPQAKTELEGLRHELCILTDERDHAVQAFQEANDRLCALYTKEGLDCGEVNRLQIQEAEIYAAMPSGALLLDPPDGGEVSLPEQVRRLVAMLDQQQNASYYLKIFIHAHQTGNSVPPHIEAEARKAAGL